MTLQTELAAAIAKVTADSTLLHKVAHGPASGTESQVVTENGPVKTVAKAIADIDSGIATTARSSSCGWNPATIACWTGSRRTAPGAMPRKPPTR